MAYQKFQKAIRPSTFQLGSFPLTEEQDAIVSEIVNGSRHVVVNAWAGTGKTSVLTHAIKAYSDRFPNHSVCFLAFNSDIKKVAESKLPGWVDVKTCHGAGYGSPARESKNPKARNPYSVVKHPNWGNGKFSNLVITGADGEHLTKFFASKIGDDCAEKLADIQACCKLLSLSKTCLLDSAEKIAQLATDYGIEFSKETKLSSAIQAVLDCMAWNRQAPGMAKARGWGGRKSAKAVEKRAITFDDQVWLPVVNGWEVPQYDLIVVDESQDLSAARLALIFLSLRPGGKLVFVGDRFQAIYGFAGASTDSFDRILETLNGTDAGVCELPMTITFRCARSIVEQARTVDDRIEIRAADTAEEGQIDSVKVEDMIEAAQPGNVILSRTNAPLIKIFFHMAKNRKKVVMLGREYGAMLTHRIKGWQRQARKNGQAFTIACLQEYNNEWLADRLEKASSESGKTRVRDEHETVLSLCEDLPLDSEDGPKEVLERLGNLFSSDNAKDAEDCIVLASTHKFKGCERERVFLLFETYRPGVSQSGREGEAQEEANLLYVGITRAKRHLSYVTGVRKAREEAA